VLGCVRFAFGKRRACASISAANITACGSHLVLRASREAQAFSFSRAFAIYCGRCAKRLHRLSRCAGRWLRERAQRKACAACRVFGQYHLSVKYRAAHRVLLIAVWPSHPNPPVERDAAQARFARLLAPLTFFRSPTWHNYDEGKTSDGRTNGCSS
jgi:hypothetical protein